MRFNDIPVSKLTANLREGWDAVWNQTPALDTPLLHPDFVMEVASAGLNVRLCADPDQGVYFPYRSVDGSMRPVADRLSDYSGFLSGGACQFGARDLLRAAQHSDWNFRNALPPLSDLGLEHHRSDCYSIRVHDGLEAWQAELKARGVSSVSQLPRKARKLAKEVGEVRLERFCDSDTLLEQLLDWKHQQRLATQTNDIFEQPWARTLAERVMRLRGPVVSGDLCALYAGDQLIAAHLGLVTDRRLHWWVPAYDAAYGRYSPGMLLLLELLKQLVSAGVQRLDLGPGDERYKVSVSNQVETVFHCSSHANALRGLSYNIVQQARNGLRGSAIESLAKGVLKRGR